MNQRNLPRLEKPQLFHARLANATNLYLQQDIIVPPILLAYTLHSSSNYIQSYKNANHQESRTAKLGEGAGTNLGLEIIHRLHLFTRSNYEATLVPRCTGCFATYQ
jgi:hypothetical protein